MFDFVDKMRAMGFKDENLLTSMLLGYVLGSSEQPAYKKPGIVGCHVEGCSGTYLDEVNDYVYCNRCGDRMTSAQHNKILARS